MAYIDLLDDSESLDEKLRHLLSHFPRHRLDVEETPLGELDHHVIAFDPQTLERVEQALGAGPGHKLYSGPNTMVDAVGVHTDLHELYWTEHVALSMLALHDSVLRVQSVAQDWGAVHQGIRVGDERMPGWSS